MGEATRVTSCLMRVLSDLDRSVNFYRDVYEAAREGMKAEVAPELSGP
jgi:hypothetical protein